MHGRDPRDLNIARIGYKANSARQAAHQGKSRAPIVPQYEGIGRFGQVHEELTEDRVPEVGFQKVSHTPHRIDRL
jgi:hypothetical protein